MSKDDNWSLYNNRDDLWYNKSYKRKAKIERREEGFNARDEDGLEWNYRRPWGGIRMPAYYWNGKTKDTENPDEKQIELCNGQNCITMIVSVASIALLSYLFSGKKMRKSKRNKTSKRVSRKK